MNDPKYQIYDNWVEFMSWNDGHNNLLTLTSPPPAEKKEIEKKLTSAHDKVK